jgi:alpha-L-arabinofuranosidase
MIKNSILVLLGMGVIISAGFCADSQAVRMDIKADSKQITVSPDLYGIFYEEINHAGDGGLYAEMVQNRSFEEHVPPGNTTVRNGRLLTKNGWRYQPFLDSGLYAWSKIEQGGAKVTIGLDNKSPLSTNTPHSMKVIIEAVGQGAGVANEGYWGMAVAAGQTYNLSLYARTNAGQTVDMTATLESADGSSVYAKSPMDGVGGKWKQYQCALKADSSDTKARLVIRFGKPVTLWLDIVSLFPQDTYKQRPGGLRRDLAEMLEGMRPQFLRFPGGCVVEGCTLDNRIQWKKTIGDIAQRPGHWDLWGYRATDGLGYHEFLQLAEDLGAAVMYVVNVGMSCQARNFESIEDMDALHKEYVQDTLDALDYAMAPVTHKWGAMRAKNGHPEPFKIKYVEIGNENGGEIYHKHYKIFYDAIKKQYPQVITIADQPIPNAPVEIIDEHYYVNPNTFFSTAEKYDAYDRKGPKIYVGEYAVNQSVGAGNLLGALAESAWMMGMERNSDVVIMASYAPLFENVNDREWPVNLILFDGSRVIGRSSYYVQKMFAENMPTVMLQSEINYPPIPAPVPQGKIGLRTWQTDAEYKDIRVTRGDKVLYASDFRGQAEGWQVKGGQWVVENGVYRQKDPTGQDTLTLFGDDTWTEYTLELKAKRNTGNEGFMALVRYSGGNGVQWNLGGWANSKHAIQVGGAIVTEAAGSIEEGRWYDVKMELKGEQVKCFLDGKLIHDTSIRVSMPRMWCANVGLDEKAGDLIVKMCNATEKAMPFDIRISGYSQIASQARVITLSGTGPDDENTLDEPKRVVPAVSTLEGVTKEFVYPARPWSVTILRIPVKKNNT